jgi:hypothetical protein
VTEETEAKRGGTSSKTRVRRLVNKSWSRMWGPRRYPPRKAGVQMTMSGATTSFPLYGQMPSLRVMGAEVIGVIRGKKERGGYRKKEHSLGKNIADVSEPFVPSLKPVEGRGGEDRKGEGLRGGKERETT